MPVTSTSLDELERAVSEAAESADRQRVERVESEKSLEERTKKITESLDSVLERLDKVAQKRA